LAQILEMLLLKKCSKSMSHLELGVAVGAAMLVGSAAVPVLWIYLRVISILSALSISQVPLHLVCHAAAFCINTHCVDVRGWSEKFSASTIDGNNIGKIFFFEVSTSVISIHVKLQVILSSSLFYTAV
jgi:hypothetical protein